MKHFRYLLGDHRIPAGKLENANSWKVAELLKKFYRDKKKALNVVVNILRTIPRMDLVERLIGKEEVPSDCYGSAVCENFEAELSIEGQAQK
ncbi:hypothetical protein chiPu_0011705 [Chiloscyllium punctatum]|uniref:Pyrin domain-containing protein n=1 Tax=Chiloscyllium punctatum TaxID=137246 RepID=A0A401SS58_CHIPU|nr:hypothetical protein [Chiloscyllium punctatum]